MTYPPFHPERPDLPLSISADDFATEYPSEGDYVEFKRGVGADPLQATIVAFSNHDGGVILVGVADGGSVEGRPLDPGTADAIHQIFRNARDPGRYSLHELLVDDRRVTVISVARRREGFAQTSSGIVRVRHGTRDDALFGVDLQHFINERSSSRYEETPVTDPAAQLENISPELASWFAEAYGWGPDNMPDRLREGHYADGDRLTVSGALYLLDNPASVLGKAYVELLRYRDDETVDYDLRLEIGGPLPVQLETAASRIQDELGTELVVLGVRRYELDRVPYVVIREAVANALAHRSYEINRTPVRIEIRPGSVQIISPGGLPEPVTVENMREATAPRNLATIAAMRRFGLAEDAGRGIDVIQDTMRDQMLDTPTFEDHGHQVVVTLPVRSTVAPVERAWIQELERRGTLEGPDRLVLVHAARGEILTNASVREILGTEAASGAREILHHLRDAGFLEQRGERGGATYHLSGSLQPPAGLRLGPDELANLVESLAADGPITNTAVREATGLDRGESLAILERLLDEGRLIRTGERRGTKYERPGS